MFDVLAYWTSDPALITALDQIAFSCWMTDRVIHWRPTNHAFGPHRFRVLVFFWAISNNQTRSREDSKKKKKKKKWLARLTVIHSTTMVDSRWRLLCCSRRIWSNACTKPTETWRTAGFRLLLLMSRPAIWLASLYPRQCPSWFVVTADASVNVVTRHQKLKRKTSLWASTQAVYWITTLETEARHEMFLFWKKSQQALLLAIGYLWTLIQSIG